MPSSPIQSPICSLTEQLRPRDYTNLTSSQSCILHYLGSSHRSPWTTYRQYRRREEDSWGALTSNLIDCRHQTQSTAAVSS
ncbi:hypothetical protein M413DRAFT_442887 [Hebeloma cylindrosporum]|uniref:Uncharacterized protein n=1 Tax=Hebeloma cylindrosporum TaxID=76867 RepID=A0A0C3C7S9_HEBCY|nr:hypothetical protein M413DRAFT_442887 [Hebeloma cylindrosporum h7]